MKITITNSEAEFYRTVAERIAEQIVHKPASLIGLATGQTMVGVYAALREMYGCQPFDTSQVTVFGLDEITNLPREYPGSCYARLLEQVVQPLGIPEAHFLMPLSQTEDFEAEAQRYEAQIAAHGQADLLLLGIGKNGHIGFNQPGTPFERRTWHSHMDPERERTMRRESGTPEGMPLGGLTLGIRTILESRRIILAANGVHKAQIVAAALRGPVTTEVPASVLQRHPDCEVILDPAAASRLAVRLPKVLNLRKSIGDSLPFLKQWAEQRSSVRVMLLTSTRAIPGAMVDALSDYDVILVVENIRPYVEDRSWLGDFGEVLVAYWDPVNPDPASGLPVCGNVTHYVDGLHIDFTLWPVELLQRIAESGALTDELEAGYRVLVDKDALAEKLPAPGYRSYIPKPPKQEEYLTLINDFLSDVPYVAKCLWRGELLPAKWCLDYDMRYVYLLKMLEWRMEMEHGWQARADINGKWLKQKLPPGLWEQVEGTMAGAGVKENWQALENSLELMRRVGREVGAHLGYAYPEQMHAGLAAYAAGVRGLAHPERVDLEGK